LFHCATAQSPASSWGLQKQPVLLDVKRSILLQTTPWRAAYRRLHFTFSVRLPMVISLSLNGKRWIDTNGWYIFFHFASFTESGRPAGR
jgi:hypothetical protein